MNISFLFPGQGSQSIGMLAAAYSEYSIVQNCFNEASEALGVDLWSLIQGGRLEELNKTENTQPAILASSVALYRVWQEAGGVTPTCVAGHSLGEYSALVASGALLFSDAVKLVRLRGRLMQSAVPLGEGAMAAVIGLDNEGVVSACKVAAQGDVVSAVNFNAPGQVVIAGNKVAVDRAIIECKGAGAKRALPLPVSVPAHSALMKQAAGQLESALRDLDFGNITIPVIQNVSAELVTDKEQIIDNLIKQLYSPVLWSQSITKLEGMNVSAVVECGPGKVLTGLAKRIDKNLARYNIEEPAALNAAILDVLK